MSVLPPDIDPKYCAIGYIVVQWGYVETLITACVLLLYHKCDGHLTEHCKESGMPRTQFSRKLDFFDEILNSPLLAKFKDEGLSLKNRAKNLSAHRDTIIHSSVIDLNPNLLQFIKLDYDNKTRKKQNKPKCEYYKYSFDDILNQGKMMQHLAFDLYPFLQRIMKEFG